MELRALEMARTAVVRFSVEGRSFYAYHVKSNDFMIVEKNDGLGHVSNAWHFAAFRSAGAKWPSVVH